MATRGYVVFFQKKNVLDFRGRILGGHHVQKVVRYYMQNGHEVDMRESEEGGGRRKRE